MSSRSSVKLTDLEELRTFAAHTAESTDARVRPERQQLEWRGPTQAHGANVVHHVPEI